MTPSPSEWVQGDQAGVGGECVVADESRDAKNPARWCQVHDCGGTCIWGTGL